MTDIKPGDRVKCGNRKGTVLGVNKAFAWVLLDGDDNPYTYRLSDLTLIPPKIAQPPVGSGVWDDGVLWVRTTVHDEWHCHKPALQYRRWYDFSDDVTLAVDPKAGA